MVTWDDHEVENNYADVDLRTATSTRSPFLRRRAAAYQAYYEHMPLRRRRCPRPRDMRVYRRSLRSTWARSTCSTPASTAPTSRAATGHRLRERSTRPHDAGRRPGAVADGGPRWAAPAGTYRAAGDDGRVDFCPDRAACSIDPWDGYRAERDRLRQFLADRRPNPIVLTGDIHTHWVNDLKVDFDDPSAEVGTEFVGTSISSGGDGEDPTTMRRSSAGTSSSSSSTVSAATCAAGSTPRSGAPTTAWSPTSFARGGRRSAPAGRSPSARARPDWPASTLSRSHQLDPVTVRVAYEAQSAAALAHAVGRLLGLDALLGQPLSVPSRSETVTAMWL